MSRLQHIVREEDGAAAIEYALLAALITTVIVGTAGLIAGGLNALLLAVSAGLAVAAG